MPKPDIDPAIVRSILNRAFPGSPEPLFKRMMSGGSTQVYRVRRDAETVYLRFGEEPKDSFAPEALVHEQLLTLGAKVPQVVFLEDRAPEVDLSVMITTEIAGQAISVWGMGSEGVYWHDPEIFREAGRDLALVNSILVRGYGFVERSTPWDGVLAGKYPFFDEWNESVFGDVHSLDRWFLDAELDVIERCVSATVVETPESLSRLAHGDFDTSHIFAENDGYIGLIDFGEIRGADRWYDVADFIVHSNLDKDGDAIDSLLSGYREILPINEDDAECIEQRAISLGAAMLIRIRDRDLPDYQTELVGSIRTLLGRELLSPLLGM